MTVYEESGLRFALPDGAHFRLADTTSYRRLSGQSLKEMDFAWLHDGKLVLLEVKDFTHTRTALLATDFLPVEDQPNPWRFDVLVTKITDTIMMMLAAWSPTAWGNGLATELPEGARKPVSLVLAAGLNMPPELRVHLSALRTALNARLQGRLKLINVHSVALMDYDLLVSRPTFSPYVSRLVPVAR